MNRMSIRDIVNLKKQGNINYVPKNQKTKNEILRKTPSRQHFVYI